MARHRAAIEWSLGEGEDFPGGRYGRGHRIRFEGGHMAPGTASAQVVGNKWAEAGAVDPEEMLVASLSSCHMLTFLHKAREAGFVVVRYRDEAEGVMEPIDGDRRAVTKVTLRPEITYQGRGPTAAERDKLHHLAHEDCFIANSVKTEVTVEER
ncbi:MAG: OsmC family peroxiredoxin [Phenylobacterium sp.]|nr:MAG: OsmC family peroxiredoxin [Phenylobacterium sp.]